MADERITAAEAAARLGVKRATLYAYVSRGMLHSRTIDGKTSTFDPAEVAALRGRRRGAKSSAVGVPMVSAITEIRGATIAYRGRNLADLVAANTPYEAVAELLWSGQTDASPQAAPWPINRRLRTGARAVQATFPADAPMLDRLRATVAYVSACDALRNDVQPRSVINATRTLLTTLVDALPRLGTEAPAGAILAERLWPRLGAAKPTPRWLRACNASLVVLADHDLAASTFAARVAASVRADVYSIVASGLGPLGGLLHGAASEPLHEAFVHAFRVGAPAAAGELLRGGPNIGGFGHFLYPDGDPRAAMLLDLVLDAAGSTRRSERVEETIALLRDRLGREPNIDCALAAMTALGSMRADAGETIFALARTTGWVAHALAEFNEEPLRFRPVSRYVG